MRSLRAVQALRTRGLSFTIGGTNQGIGVVRRYAASSNHPVDEIVNERLDDDLTNLQTTATDAPIAEPPEIPRTQKEETIARAQIVFGSKLVGPARRAQLDAQSSVVAGILVPSKPEEPENCCMSGCVNCVWDMYREEMEEWVAKSTQARAKLAEQKAASRTSQDNVTAASMSMDDDGGGSESNWNDEGPIEGDIFGGIPVGIRAFMDSEKALKAKHKAHASVNG